VSLEIRDSLMSRSRHTGSPSLNATANEIRRVTEIASPLSSRFRSDIGRAPILIHSGQKSEFDGLSQPPGRWQKENPIVGSRPASPLLVGDSETLLPRPYLMASRVARHTLDVAIALCCSFVTVLVPERHLLPLLSKLTDSASPRTPLFSGIEIIVFSGCVAALLGIFELHPTEYLRTVSSELVLVTLSVSLSAFGVAGALGSLVSTTSPAKLLEVLLTSSALFLSRILWRRYQDADPRDFAGRNILIVGANPIGRAVEDYLFSMPYLGFRLKGFVKLSEDTDDTAVSGKSPIAGGVEDVIAIAKAMFVDEIIFSYRPTTPNVISEVLAQAQASGIDVRLIPSLSETLRNRPDLEYLGNLPTIVMHRREKHAVSNLLKRVIDVALAGLGSIVLSPLFVIIGVLIKFQSPGPVLYRSKRVGYKGTTFYCYKFRSMIEHADAARDRLAHLNERCGILFKIAKDPRVTPVGAFLRKYSLDELPQLWNVLIGDMSLVGPRPSIRSEVVQYKTDHLRRLDAVPGMTGLWQVEARQDPSFERYVNLDNKYVRDWSIWLDVKILARTLGAVLKGTGA
jgi:exopolysaccharide biosynthesis polyprenyl glycosylphosphotransferase